MCDEAGLDLLGIKPRAEFQALVWLADEHGRRPTRARAGHAHEIFLKERTRHRCTILIVHIILDPDDVWDARTLVAQRLAQTDNQRMLAQD